MWSVIKPQESNLRWWQVGLLAAVLGLWQWASTDPKLAFFLGNPVQVMGRVWTWFVPMDLGPSFLFPDGLNGRADIYIHLGVTLLETVLAFGLGTLLGLVCGLWLALSPLASAILDPYIKAAKQVHIRNLIRLESCVGLQIKREVGDHSKRRKHHACRHGIGLQMIGVYQDQSQIGQQTRRSLAQRVCI